MRAHLRLLSGLVALSTILPTTAYADENADVRGDVEGNSVTITGTTRTQIQSPGQPDTGTPYTGGGDGGASAASADGADGGATRPCYLGILDLKAMYTFSCLFAPAAPDPGTGAGAGGEPPTTATITATDAAALLIDGSGLHRQPPGPQALITLDVIAYTSPDTRTLTTTVAGTPVTVTATPTAYAFDWGDGTTTTTTDPGAPTPTTPSPTATSTPPPPSPSP